MVPLNHAAHAHGALGGVVQAGDEVYERGLGRAGAADDADGLAALNVQVDIVERLALRMRGILKAHVVKVDGAVGHLEHGLGGSMMTELTLRGRGDGVLLVPVEPKSARELGMAVRAGEGRQASLQQFLECAQTVLAELEPK